MLDITNKKLTHVYDKELFNFQDLFQGILSSEDHKIEDIHNVVNKSILPKTEISVDNDQRQDIYEVLYAIDKGYNLDLDTPKRGQFLTLFDE